VTGYLRPAIKHGAVDLWLDRLTPGAADWEPGIEQKLRVCDIFILLVSRHSMASDYIVDKEVAIIRERQAKGEAVHFYPLVLTPTPKIALSRVHDKNLRPRDSTPFSGFSVNERYQHMAEVADEIAEIASEIETNRMASSSQALQPRGASVAGSDVHIENVNVNYYARRNGRSDDSRSVFISYRREDSPGLAGRIYDRSSGRLSRKRVFFDVDNIRPGRDFRRSLSEQVSACDVLLAVLGKGWLTAIDEQNRRRIDDPNDLVRIEVETALNRGIIVIPVLLDGAAMRDRKIFPLH
jgi:hypothetical protein